MKNFIINEQIRNGAIQLIRQARHNHSYDDIAQVLNMLSSLPEYKEPGETKCCKKSEKEGPPKAVKKQKK